MSVIGQGKSKIVLTSKQDEGLASSIEDLELSTRATNALQDANIGDVEQVVEMSKLDVSKIKNFGKKSLQELSEALARYDLNFGMDLDNCVFPVECDEDEEEITAEQEADKLCLECGHRKGDHSGHSASQPCLHRECLPEGKGVAYTRCKQFRDTLEAVNHPAHYGGDTTYEVIKVLEAWGLDKSFCLGNTVKYIARADKKNNRLEDLKKARWYLDREISNMETK